MENNKCYKEIYVRQGSELWLLYRRSHLGATDSSKISGVNKYASPLDCYNDKIEGKETFISPAMQRGMDLEPVARRFLENKYSISLKPKVFESTIYKYASASLDAITDDFQIMAEIKCVGERTMSRAFRKDVDDMYLYQCQKQMFVMGLEKMKLFFYYSDDINHEIEVLRDEKIIDKIIKAEADFWNNHLLPKIPPSKVGANYSMILCDKLNDMAKCRNKLYEQEKVLKAEREAIEVKLKESSNGNSFFVDADLKLTKTERKGAIDYKKACKSYSISEEDLEKYRKEKTEYSTFTTI